MKMRKVLTELQTELLGKARTLLLQETTELFESNPDLVAITWYQYTPLFNDGDPCENSIGEVTAISTRGLEKMRKKFDEPTKPVKEFSPNEIGKSWIKNDPQISDSVREFLNEVYALEDIWERLFQTNKQIFITRDGVTINDYFEEY